MKQKIFSHLSKEYISTQKPNGALLYSKEIVKYFGWTDINFGWYFNSLNDPYHISVSKIGDGGIK